MNLANVGDLTTALIHHLYFKVVPVYTLLLHRSLSVAVLLSQLQDFQLNFPSLISGRFESLC